MSRNVLEACVLYRRFGRATVLLLAACSMLLCTAVTAFMPGVDGDSPKAAAVRSDIKFIRCQVCEAVMKQATRKVKAMKTELKPGQQLHEDGIINTLETLCSTDKPDGAWITHYDIVEDGDRLKLVDIGKPSRCNSECATIARACTEVTESLDLSDISEELYKGKSRSSLTQLACYDMTNVCRIKPPPVPKGRERGPEHVPMTEEEAQREEMMAKMKAAGMKGQMYNRDDIMSQMNDLQDLADSGDIPSTPLREAEPASQGAAASVLGAMSKAGEVAQEAISWGKAAAADALTKATGLLKGALNRVNSVVQRSVKQEL